MTNLRVPITAAAAALLCAIWAPPASAQPGQTPAQPEQQPPPPEGYAPPPPPDGYGPPPDDDYGPPDGDYEPQEDYPPPDGYGPPPRRSRHYPPPPPPVYGPAVRRGLTLGAGFGIGNMSASSGPIECFDCDYDTGAFGFDFHIGGMLSPHMALLFELWVTGKTLDYAGTELMTQSFAMVAAQYWVTPRLWLKGGLGAAQLRVTWDDGFVETAEDGFGVMGAVGYELFAGQQLAIDLQLRFGTGSYDTIDEQISAGTLGVGMNWY
ncbi:hypothetical protein [Haliangium sp.]|uniref:hypothetical protein n=1 Tax=Haliangium sp. TaxID=2663208 RepID=UPI003D0B0C96